MPPEDPDRPIPADPACPACVPRSAATLPEVLVIAIRPETPLTDYREAIALANAEARRRLAEPMLLSWYDRDRNFESPQHASECHEASAIPGYVDYGLSHGATLKVDIEDGRFVFFYLSAEL